MLTHGMQLNEALGDVPCETMEYSMRQEQDMMVRVAERVAAAMARCAAPEVNQSLSVQDG
jgi:hypothetical protein